MIKSIDFKYSNAVYGKNQDEYENLYVLKFDENGEVISCWKLSFIDRLKILLTGKMWISVLTFGNKFQPMKLSVNKNRMFVVNKKKVSLLSKIKKFFKEWKYIQKNDPVKKCELYKQKGCSHVDGPLCDFPECSMNKSFIKENNIPDYVLPKNIVKTYFRKLKKHFIFKFLTKSFNISFEICGYFDNRPIINIDLILFSLQIIFPFRNKWTDECDAPKWGIAIHNNTFWIYRGGKGNFNGGNKWWTWNIPFFTKEWIRTSILLENDIWEHETKKEKKNFYEDKWKNKQKSWTYDYEDKYDGEIIPTTIYVEEREWRPKWLTWTKKFAYIRKSIDIHFSKEVGKRKSSWKGGVLQCGYDIINNEHPLDCLKRMEKEREL